MYFLAGLGKIFIQQKFSCFRYIKFDACHLINYHTPPLPRRLYGGYEALKGGKTSEAMVDFTGGVVEAFDLEKAGDDLYDRLERNAARYSLMSCSIK